MKKIFIYLSVIYILCFIPNKLFSQKQFEISGLVIDSKTNLGMQGVTISVKLDKRKKGLSYTRKDGVFKVNVPQDSTLIFSYTGYDDVVQKVDATKDDYVIKMNITENPMKDVVVVGYQNRERETLTGDVAVVSGKDLQDVPAANVLDLLQGKVAGLNIQNNNGTPGMSGTIQLRGLRNIDVQGSGDQAYLNPTSPLFVIDGVPVDMNSDYQYGFQDAGPGISPLSLIPTEDIAEVQVLKDAQATALYGSKGAYGVILITTKRGQSEVPIIQYSSKYFVNSKPAFQKVIAGVGERWLRINQILRSDTSYIDALDLINRSDMLSDSLNPYYNNATDWQSLFYRSTFNMSQNVNISGGNNKFNYSVNAGYYDEKGIIENTGFSRYNLSVNASYKPSDKFSFSTQINTGLGLNSKGSGNALFQTGVGNSAKSSSLLPSPSLYIASNETLAAVGIDDNNKTGNVSTNISMRYQPITGISASSTFSYSYNTGTETTLTPSALNSGYGKIMSYNSTKTSVYNRNTLAFTKSLNKMHNFNLYFFNEISASQSRIGNLNEEGMPNDQISGPLGYNWTKQGGSFGFSESKSVGFAGAFSYNYNSKYAFDFSYRMDGTSTNGPNAKWTENPSLGLRWNIGKEKFMKSFDWIDYTSVRGSWGRSIVPTGSIYDIYGKYDINSLLYNSYQTISIDLGSVPNLNLVPSTSTMWNFGFDLGVLKNKLSFSFSTYYNQSDKLLRSKNIATLNGFTSINTNETSLVNYGYEFSLNYRPLSRESKFDWSISANAAINHDIIAHLPDGVRQLALQGGSTNQPTLFRLGSNTLSNLLYNYIGVYPSTSDVPVDPNSGLRYKIGGNSTSLSYFGAGDPMWVDINGDYVLDQNDLVIVGDFEPRVTGGMSTRLSYSSFSLNINMSYTLGRDLLNNALADRFRNFYNPLNTGALVPVDGFDIWQDVGNSSVYPNPYDYTRSGVTDPYRYNQTLFLEDGSYVKLNSVTFSYNVNKNLTKRYGVTSLRFYGTASNLYTFSLFSGPNAEMASALGISSANQYPTSPSYTFGIDIQF